MNSLRFIKQTLYSLKRDFGLPVNIVWRLSSVADLETGRKTVVQDSVKVDLALVLPGTLQRDFVYDLSFIASNKNFTYGGLFDKRRRKVIIDRDDLPADFEIKIGYFMVISGFRYEVKNADYFEERNAYDIDVEQVDNIELANNIKQVVCTDWYLDHTLEVEINGP